MKRKHHIALFADEDEQARLEFIKKTSLVKTDADAVRIALLFTSNAKGFFAHSNTSSEVSTTEAKER